MWSKNAPNIFVVLLYSTGNLSPAFCAGSRNNNINTAENRYQAGTKSSFNYEVGVTSTQPEAYQFSLITQKSKYKRAIAVDDSSTKLLDGVNAKVGEFPFLASLKYYGSHSCGASILDSNHILTGVLLVNIHYS